MASIRLQLGDDPASPAVALDLADGVRYGIPWDQLQLSGWEKTLVAARSIRRDGITLAASAYHTREIKLQLHIFGASAAEVLANWQAVERLLGAARAAERGAGPGVTLAVRLDNAAADTYFDVLNGELSPPRSLGAAEWLANAVAYADLTLLCLPWGRGAAVVITNLLSRAASSLNAIPAGTTDWQPLDGNTSVSRAAASPPLLAGPAVARLAVGAVANTGVALVAGGIGVGASAGESWAGSLYVRLAAPASGVTARLQLYGGGAVQASGPVVALTTSWQRLSVSGTTGTGMLLTLRLVFTSAVACTVDADAAMLEKGVSSPSRPWVAGMQDALRPDRGATLLVADPEGDVPALLQARLRSQYGRGAGAPAPVDGLVAASIASTSGGSLAQGSWSFRITYVYPKGETDGNATPASVTTTNTTSQILVTVTPPGSSPLPLGVQAINVYAQPPAGGSYRLQGAAAWSPGNGAWQLQLSSYNSGGAVLPSSSTAQRGLQRVRLAVRGAGEPARYPVGVSLDAVSPATRIDYSPTSPFARNVLINPAVSSVYAHYAGGTGGVGGSAVRWQTPATSWTAIAQVLVSEAALGAGALRGRFDVFARVADYSSGAPAPQVSQVRALPGGSLTAGATYYYVVTAVTANLGASESLPSPEVAFTASSGSRSVQLIWPAVPGLLVVQYRVYRTTISGNYSGNKLVGTVTSPPQSGLVSFTDSGATTTAGSPPASGGPAAMFRLAYGLAGGAPLAAGPPAFARLANGVYELVYLGPVAIPPAALPAGLAVPDTLLQLQAQVTYASGAAVYADSLWLLPVDEPVLAGETPGLALPPPAADFARLVLETRPDESAAMLAANATSGAGLAALQGEGGALLLPVAAGVPGTAPQRAAVAVLGETWGGESDLDTEGLQWEALVVTPRYRGLR